MSMTELLFSFEGRINRRMYWVEGGLLLLVPIIIFALIAIYLDEFFGTTPLFLELLRLLLLWPAFAISAKRWHDRDKSGWWSLIGLIPYVGPIWILIELGFLKGTDGPNRFDL